MATMRAQVSLMFDDADLFDNFITPCKEERRLNGIIVKCLRAYYLDERVRNMIEGEELADDSDDSAVKSTQSICDSIRASFIMQDFLVEELKQTIETGIEDVGDILSKANASAEANGFGSSYQTKSGSTILQLEAPKQEKAPEAVSTPVTGVVSASPDLASILCQAVLLLAKDSNNSQVTALLQQVSGVVPQVISPVAPETPRQEAPPEVHLPAVDLNAGFTETEPVVDVGGGNDFEASEPASEPASESAMDAMADLLGSLG